MASSDTKSGVSRNTANYNRSSLAVAIDAINETGASYFADSAQSLELIIAGTFVGTIEVQSAPLNADLSSDAQWGAIASYTTTTSKIIEIVAPVAVRVRSTAWTSGTANTSLIGNVNAQKR
jgi:hypothetical protein